MSRASAGRIACGTLAALILVWQLWVPPLVGLANNGDFPKVAGWLSLGPAQGSWADNFHYFVSSYTCSSKFYWPNETISSEVPLGAASKVFACPGYDIRRIGAVHIALFLIAWAILIWLARPSFAATLCALFIFTDIAYVAYFNSFYTDTAAILGAAFMVALALSPPSLAISLAFSAAALLFIGSKSQHALLALAPAYFVFTAEWKQKRRGIAVLLGALLLTGGLITVRAAPEIFKRQAAYNVIFRKLSKAPGDLIELGLDPSFATLIGTNAFQQNSPANDMRWLEQFDKRSGFRAILHFYASHPLRATAILAADLQTDAYQIRPLNLANRRREDGYKPDTLSGNFSTWSDIRSRAFRVWPTHAAIWLWSILLYGGYSCLPRRDSSRLVSPAMKTLTLAAVLAIGEFCISSLADAVETYRHLLLFHFFTDVTICLAIGAAITGVQHRIVRALVSRNLVRP